MVGFYRKTQTEFQLQYSESKLRAVIDSALDAVIGMDQHGLITEWNRQAESIFGWSRQEAVGRNLGELIIPPEYRDAHNSGMQRVLSSGKGPILNRRIEVSGQNREGKYFPVELTVTAQRLQDTYQFTAFIRDITSRKRAEETKGLLAAIVESSDDAIISKNLDSIITSWNSGAESLFGYPATQMIGQHISKIIPPDRLEEERHIIANLRQGISIRHFETVRRRKDGKTIDISLTVSPIRNDEGKVVGASKVARDITDRKRTEEELRITLEKVITANREAEEARQKAEIANNTKSDFLANMSHEIRTPLNSMIGLSEMLLETELSSQQENHIRTVMNSGETLLEIINDMLDLSKIESGKLELDPIPFDLEAAVDDTAELVAPKAREKEQQVELLVNFVPGTPRHVIGDQVRLRQILANLLANAIKFTPAGYILIVVEELSEALPENSTKIKITVQDTGIGIPETKLNLIFEKFSQADVSTTRKFGGTGLGLSICRQLAHMMQGDVSAQSEQGKGSTFSVTLILERDPHPPAEALPADRALLAGKKALVVDDIEASRTIIAAQLATAGIKSVPAGNARDALSMLAAAQDKGVPFDFMVTDYILPEMESDMFTTLAKTIYPDMPVVMVTAFAEKGYAQIFASVGCDAYLIKPVRTSQLLDLLAMIFTAKHAGRHLSMLTPLTVFRKGNPPKISEDGSFLEGAHILLVEDHRANRELVLKLLENFGCHAMAAHNGEEAIEMIKKHPFDLILMDCQMPEMDGFEASVILSEMKKRGEIPDIPIIALTANAMKGDREKCLESGMNDYLTKPLRKTSLRNALMYWLPPKEKRPPANN